MLTKLGRAVWRMGLWGGAVYVATFLALCLWTFAAPLPQAQSQADVIAVFAGGVGPKGRLTRGSAARTDAGIALYKAGIAPKIVMSGAASRLPTSAADIMAQRALGAGVPEADILREPLARSTLQNALFTLDRVGTDKNIIVVTEHFHTPRAQASLWAFGAASPQAHGVASPAPLRIVLRFIAREALAIWFNAARFCGWKLGTWMGMDEAVTTAWLT